MCEILSKIQELIKSVTFSDWLSNILSIFSILFAYYLGERNYKRDKKNREDEENDLIRFENELFEGNLQILENRITKQIQILEKYLDEKDFKLEIVSVNVNFLSFIDVKNIYRNNKKGEDELNSLLISLYGINKFESSITDEFRTFIRRYNELEAVFRDNYTIVFYDLYFETTARRAKEFIVENEIKKWRYCQNDEFMKKYGNFVNDFLKENESVTDREKIKNKLKGIAEMTGEYIPEDYDAIQVSRFSNKSYHEYLNMENLIKAHFIVIRAYLDGLEKAKEKINSYLKR